MSFTNIKTEILGAVESACQSVFGQKPKTLKLGYPPKIEFGDFAVECFPLAKQFRQNPTQIAQAIAAEIRHGESIREVSAVGPYLNFKIDNRTLFDDVCAEIMQQGEDFGNTNTGRDHRVMIEYLSPNTNKPLHLGHIRNGVLGMTISNLLEATGHKVIKANLVNDRGIHICKSMLAWSKWGDGTTPESTGTKSDHFVGNWYVRYAQEEAKDSSLEQQTQQMLRKWEASDAETIQLWKMMNQWVYDGFDQTHQKLGLEFDIFYYESDTYKLGKDIIETGLNKDIFGVAENGATVATLPIDEFGTDKDGTPKKVTVLRADGTSVYMTQDLGTAQMKFDKHGLDRSIYVVGSEQIYHFKCLFKLLEMLGFEWASGCYHLSYGMVLLPEGKMKSREGKVVDADDLIEEMRQLAEDEIRARDSEGKLSDEVVQNRSLAIGLAAIKFYLLRVRPELDINFDPKESISFDGFTGPYCQYAYARCASILRNAMNQDLSGIEPDFSRLGNEEELQLIQTLIQFPEAVETTAREFTPAGICSQVFATAQAFNQFYHKHPVLSTDSQALTQSRLALVQATSTVLKKGLTLLGIEVLEEM